MTTDSLTLSSITGSGKRVSVLGGGLAGCEAALQLAKHGIAVNLYEMKPLKRSPAHHSNTLAEIVCSNSFGSQGEGSASGLIKLEMAALGCELLKIAQSVSVPAGQALAVDREAFAEKVTRAIETNPLITWIEQEATTIPSDTDFCLIATGPLTTEPLIKSIGSLLEREQLYFFDAAAPIIVKDSINLEVAFVQDRYAISDRREVDLETLKALSEKAQAESSQSYINCPLNQAEYQALHQALVDAERTELKSFEKESAHYFESCLPIEVIAERGEDTLRYGPFKPVGLIDPRDGKRPYAVVQLRQDNAEGTLYNMVGCQTNIKWGAQKEIIQMIPGLEQAEVVRFGVMHRNTFIHSPDVLSPTLQLKKHPHILFAGQLTGTEGYTESIATGLVAALNLVQLCQGSETLQLPKETMLGSLLAYITRPEAIGKSFQPINSNWGILPPVPEDQIRTLRKNKPLRNQFYRERSLASLKQFMNEQKLNQETAVV